MGRKIVVTSGKGGVGKTTIVAGIARALASLNVTVCVIDADIGLNNLDLVMNVENKVVYDLIYKICSNTHFHIPIHDIIRISKGIVGCSCCVFSYETIIVRKDHFDSFAISILGGENNMVRD